MVSAAEAEPGRPAEPHALLLVLDPPATHNNNKKQARMPDG